MLENIIIEPAEYISKYKIKVSKNLLIRIKSLFVGYSTSHQCLKINELLKENKQFYELNAADFSSFFYDLKEKSKYLSGPARTYKNDLDEDVIINFDTENEEVQKLTYQLLEINKNDILNFIENSQGNKIEEMLECYELLFALNKKMYKKRDLILEKVKIVESLKSIVSTEQLNDIENKYNTLLEENNIKLLEQFLKNLQEIIKDDYKNKITDVNNYIPGQSFKFLCHATRHTKWEGNFRDRYVSASLLSNEVFGTYTSSFGFIVAPENIVGADSDDMYVKNSAENNEQITLSSIPKINSIEKIVKDCKKRKIKEEGNVYNEVVLEGFKPVALFCKTTGEKTLNNDYRCVLELQKSFPHLKIIDIDLSLYLEGENLLIQKRELIFKLLQKTNQFYKDYGHEYVKNINIEDYDLFWGWYTNLKLQPEYTEEEIMNLFKRNEALLSTSMFPEKIFNGEYTEEEIEFALLHGYNYRIKDLLNGNFSSYNISSVINLLKKYKDNPILLKLFPGINFVIELYPRVKMTIEMTNEIKNIESLNFNKLYLYLSECYKKQLDTEKSNVNTELNNLLSKKEDLEQQYLDQQQILNIQEKSKKIISDEIYYTLALNDYNDELLKKQIIEEKINQIEQELNTLNSTKNQFLEQQSKYEKHKFINRRKLQKLKKELYIIEEKINSILDLKNIKEIGYKNVIDKIFEIKQRFKKETNIDLFEYKKELEKANNIFDIGKYVDAKFNIKLLINDLDKLQKQIDEVTLKFDKIKREILNIIDIEENNKTL